MGALKIKIDDKYELYLKEKREILIKQGETPESVDAYIKRIKKIHNEMEIKG